MTAIFRSIAIALLICTSLIGSADAAVCRSQNGHNICILNIQRSAKYFWEYRVAVRIDDQIRPVEVYSCRDRIRVRQDGSRVPFESQSVGDLICRLVSQRR